MLSASVCASHVLVSRAAVSYAVVSPLLPAPHPRVWRDTKSDEVHAAQRTETSPGMESGDAPRAIDIEKLNMRTIPYAP